MYRFWIVVLQFLILDLWYATNGIEGYHVSLCALFYNEKFTRSFLFKHSDAVQGMQHFHTVLDISKSLLNNYIVQNHLLNFFYEALAAGDDNFERTELKKALQDMTSLKYHFVQLNTIVQKYRKPFEKSRASWCRGYLKQESGKEYWNAQMDSRKNLVKF